MTTVTRMLADPLALIDRNFQGFGKELFTDAGKYVIHFGDRPEEAAEQAANIVKAAHPDKPAPPVTAVAKYRNPDMHVIATSTADQLVNLPSAFAVAVQRQHVLDPQSLRICCVERKLRSQESWSLPVSAVAKYFFI